MKNTVLTLLLAFYALTGFAQSPTIAGDTMLCPESFGTATVTNDQEYDTYQWYYKILGSSGQLFIAVEGETSSSFTYDSYNYGYGQIKLVVTLAGQTYESNILSTDGYAFTGMTVISELNEFVTIDAGVHVLCAGHTFPAIVQMPYTTNVQWYKNAIAIQGANSPTYQISGPGDYTVKGAPGECPNFIETSLPITVIMNTECNLGIPESTAGLSFEYFPNPVNESLQFTASKSITNATIYNLAGQTILTVKPNTTYGAIQTSQLASGVYILDVQSETFSEKIRIVKN